MNNQDVNALIQQGIRCHDQGDYLRAIAYFEESAALARVQDKPDSELYALSYISIAWSNIPDPQRALESGAQLLVRAHQLHNEDYLMNGSLRMAEAISKFDLRRRWPELKLLLEEGLQTARRLSNHWFETYHLLELGSCATHVHELEHGFTWTQEALTSISPGMDKEHFLRGRAYQVLSRVMRERKDYAEAVRFAEMALGEFQIANKPVSIAYTQLDLARAERECGKRGEALSLVEEVYQQSKQKAWKAGEQEAAYLRGELEREIGHPGTAEEFSRLAIHLARELKRKEEEVECLLSLGKALKVQGRRSEARAVWQEARQLSRECEYEDHFNEVEELLSTLEQ